MKHANSTELNKWIASQSNGTCLLSFSTGKDSICAWLELRKHFKHIKPFYCQLIPGLSFVERSLKYYEEFFQTPIYRMVHPFCNRLLNNLVFQSPERCSIIEKADLPSFDYADVYRMIKEDAGLSQSTWTAIGTRAADNPLRQISVKQRGAYNDRLKTFMPVFDWKKDRVISEIQSAGVKLPAEYKTFGRSFDGLDFRFLAPLKQYFPADYAKVIELFPLADMEFARRDFEHA